MTSSPVSRRAADLSRSSSASRPSTARARSAYGREKLAAKGLDVVVVNDISRKDIGFDSEANEVVIVTLDAQRRVPRVSKTDVADAVLDEVARRREEADGGTRAHAGSTARD